MLTQVEQAEQKWGGFHNVIDCWLQERKQLLVQYCELAGLPPFERDAGALPDKTKVREFCEVLVDYVSVGHFELYDKIAAECESEGADPNFARELFPKISATTDVALTFNDTFAEIGANNDVESFDSRLSNLGQQLEERFELEDQLISTLHTGNR